MTISETVDYFDLLQDKYGSPYFTDGEKEKLLGQAQLDVIGQFFPKDGGPISIEQNANTWIMFDPLFFSLSTGMTSAGVITKADVESSLTTSLGFTVKIIRPLSISWTDSDGTRPVTGPTRQNNWAKYMNNVFKVPVVKDPRYYQTNSSYVISPINTSATITINGIRYPKTISISGAQGFEVSELYHNEVVARALEAAGVGSRDQMLSELKKLNNV